MMTLHHPALVPNGAAARGVGIGVLRGAGAVVGVHGGLLGSLIHFDRLFGERMGALGFVLGLVVIDLGVVRSTLALRPASLAALSALLGGDFSASLS